MKSAKIGQGYDISKFVEMCQGKNMEKNDSKGRKN